MATGKKEKKDVVPSRLERFRFICADVNTVSSYKKNAARVEMSVWLKTYRHVPNKNGPLADGFQIPIA